MEEKSSFIAAGSDGVGSEGVMVDVRSGSSMLLFFCSLLFVFFHRLFLVPQQAEIS